MERGDGVDNVFWESYHLRSTCPWCLSPAPRHFYRNWFLHKHSSFLEFVCNAWAFDLYKCILVWSFRKQRRLCTCLLYTSHKWYQIKVNFLASKNMTPLSPKQTRANPPVINKIFQRKALFLIKGKTNTNKITLYKNIYNFLNLEF